MMMKGAQTFTGGERETEVKFWRKQLSVDASGNTVTEEIMLFKPTLCSEFCVRAEIYT